MRRYASWGNFPPVGRQDVTVQSWRHQELPSAQGTSLLPYGLGRSYGDSCLNEGGTLVDTRQLDHLIDFDSQTGVLRCEAGLSLARLLQWAVPRGWFVPVTPGTKFVTIGGAIANDIHGKNHHRAGTFGCHVRRLELCRSDGGRVLCSPEENTDLFAATIGGLGLTGLITWAEFALVPIAGDRIDVESVRFGGLDEFFELAADSDAKFDYTVAWVDALARGKALGRGHYLRGRHATEGSKRRPSPPPRLSVPIDAPSVLLGPTSVRWFNRVYYHRQRKRIVRRRVHYDPFFYPLDKIAHWNRLYGRRGFLQYQCLMPPAVGREAMRELLGRIERQGEGSFLAVLKLFGDVVSPGLLSFPRPGPTLALDFQNRGERTLRLLDDLDAIVVSAGGRVYPAKDARMSGASFRRFFPEWERLAPRVDPRFSSSFWRRVTGAGAEAA